MMVIDASSDVFEINMSESGKNPSDNPNNAIHTLESAGKLSLSFGTALLPLLKQTQEARTDASKLRWHYLRLVHRESVVETPEDCWNRRQEAGGL